MFKTTATGYVATAETVTWWESRDTCPCCGSVCDPISTENGMYSYRCPCDSQPVEWTREA